jgi:hypothetical protein
MRLADRIRRWWKPAQWRDEHPDENDGEGHPLSASDRGAAQFGFWQGTEDSTDGQGLDRH